MEIINFIVVVLMLIGMFGLGAMFLSVPGWVLGRVSWRRDRRFKANLFTETPRRRKVGWWVSSMLAFLFYGHFANGHMEGLLGVAVFSLAAQYMAFSIGMAAADRKDAHRNEHLYAALPEGLGPQHMHVPTAEGAVAAGRIATPHAMIPPEMPTMVNTWSGRDSGVDREAIITNAPFGTNMATTDYPMAQPHDD